MVDLAAKVESHGFSPGRQLGLLWGASALGLLVLAARAATRADLLPQCLFKTVTGLPCLGCGTTRSALALAQLDLGPALAVSPLATLGWLGLVVGGLVAGALALAGVPVREPKWQWGMGRRLLAALVLLSNWIYLIWAGV